MQNEHLNPETAIDSVAPVDALVSNVAPHEFSWPDPKPEDLEAEDFTLVWECIKTWDINVPEAYAGYCGATGNHVMAILFATGKRNITDYC